MADGDTALEWMSEHHAPAAPPSPSASVTTLERPAPWFYEFLTGRLPGETGPVVNEHTALNYAALYSCVTLIAGTIASLPLKVYRRLAGGKGQEEAVDRSEYN